MVRLDVHVRREGSLAPYTECNADDCENREELLPEENLTDTEDSNSTGTYSETEVADHTENIYIIYL